MEAASSYADFDVWRREYDTLSFEDHKRYYEDWARRFPCQQSWNLKYAQEFMDRFQPRTVIELGGWDGSLAAALIPGNFVLSWRNYDLIEVPQVCELNQYELRVLDQPLWECGPLFADAFVATHTIEHLKARELELLIPKLNVTSCLVEAPIERRGREWWGYEGSHILEIGWDGVDDIFAQSGFEVTHLWGHGRFYARA